MTEISAREQEMLELINRARANPGGEFALAIADAATVTGTTSDITGAIRFFGVDPIAYRDAMAGFSSVAPLAWSPELAAAATGHSQAQLAADLQSHQVPGEPALRDRAENAGYTNWRSLGENVYAYAEDVFEGHVAFMIDWGYDDEDFDGSGNLLPDWKTRGDGMQDPAGHRNSIMSATFTEIGISVISDPSETNRIGPNVVTQNFGTRFNDSPQLLGVVIDDGDGDRFYDAGEGLGGVTVTVLQGSAVVSTTTTWDAGGYQLELAPGNYTVRFSGGSLNGVIETAITMGDENLKVDGIADDAVTGPTNGADVLTGTPLAELINALGGADWITPGGGNDTVDGGPGRDMVSFANLPDTPGRTNANFRLDIDLSANRAVNHDGSENISLMNVERITGTIFADLIKGDDGDNELRGLGDYDWFLATEGNDTIDGGNGLDMLSFADYQTTNVAGISDIFSSDGMPPTGAQAPGIVLDLEDPSKNTGLAAGQNLTSIERITGSGYQDVFYGDSGQNDFRGLGGYDWFVSSTGGRERYFGGDGLDTVTYYNASSGVTASLSNGATVNGQETGYGSRGDAARDLYFEIENLVGSRYDDDLRGSSGRNQLSGLEGDDFLFGAGGVDYLMGGAGNDTINGGAGSDYALFSGNSSEYTLTRNGNDVTVAGPDGIDSLTEVEYFRFEDTDLTIWEL